MKIKSTAQFNTSVSARHTANDGKIVIGGSTPSYLNVPAGATIELADAEYKKFEEAAAPLLEGGTLVMVEAPALTPEEVEALEAAELAKAEVLVSKAKSKKAK